MDKNVDQSVYISNDPLDRKWLDINIPCQAACPIMTDIPGYIQAIMNGDYETAYKINRSDNVLPSILGRVCHRPCEHVCRHGRDGLGDPVSICHLKRSSSDFGMESWQPDIKKNEKTICVIGAGPAGLTAANDLALRGYSVTILEQYKEAGGMLRYGIPQFRLPYDILEKDIKSIADLGVSIKTNERIKSEKDIEQLQQEYDAVILAGGCQLPKKTNISDAKATGFFWGLDYMMQTNENLMTDSFKKVVVIGGGFTAVDCTRMAYRLGAEKVTLAYRRTKDDLRVSLHEVDAMEAEGVVFDFLASPLELKVVAGRVSGIRFIKNSIQQDRSIQPIPKSEFIIDADCVILAIGQEEEGDLFNDEEKDTSNFYIAGDFRNGASTVIEAAADGRNVAKAVHRSLSAIDGYQDTIEIQAVTDTGRERDYDFIPRQAMPETPLAERTDKIKEVEIGYKREGSLIESRRCYLCFYNFQIDIDRCIYCLKCIDVMPVNCIKMAKDIEIAGDDDLHYVETNLWSEAQAIVIDNDACIRCGNCVSACPVDCISISKYGLKVNKV
jgi:glutamate synthase (NADPH) small chain